MFYRDSFKICNGLMEEDELSVNDLTNMLGLGSKASNMFYVKRKKKNKCVLVNDSIESMRTDYNRAIREVTRMRARSN